MLQKTLSFSRIEGPAWSGRPVAIVGNGPSIVGLDLQRRLVGFHVLAVKGAIWNLDGLAECGFGLDIPRYVEWSGMFNRVSMRVYWATPKLEYLGDGPHAPNVRILRRIDISSLSDDPTAICSGGSSGYGALNLACLREARRILLLGYDYNADMAGLADDRAYVDKRAQDAMRWVAWAKNFDKIKPVLAERGIRVINASPASRITAFPRMPFSEAMDAINA